MLIVSVEFDSGVHESTTDAFFANRPSAKSHEYREINKNKIHNRDRQSSWRYHILLYGFLCSQQKKNVQNSNNNNKKTKN